MATRKSAALEKAPTTSTAVAVKPNTNIVSIKEQLAKQAAELNERTAPPSGSKIRVTQDKKFILPDGSETAGPLEMVIVDFTTVHKFYTGNYDPKNITPPACFAIGLNPKQMVPSKNSPELQSDDCQGCPNNQFGSAGDGKACKNTRLMAVLPPDADADTPMWTLEASPTAIKGFDGYVQAVARSFGMPPVAVVTTVSFDESVTYAKLKFSDPLENPALAVHFARQAEAREMLAAEPDLSGYVKPGAKPAARGRVAVGGRR